MFQHNQVARPDCSAFVLSYLDTDLSNSRESANIVTLAEEDDIVTSLSQI